MPLEPSQEFIALQFKYLTVHPSNNLQCSRLIRNPLAVFHDPEIGATPYPETTARFSAFQNIGKHDLQLAVMLPCGAFQSFTDNMKPVMLAGFPERHHCISGS